MSPKSSDLFAGRVRVDGTRSLFLIAGPCVLEDEDLNLLVAEQVAKISAQADIPAIFKASFDKANRSSLESPRGPGLIEGCEVLRRIREQVGLPVLTDIHLPEQAIHVAEAVDALQIPAFLCRQTDLLEAAARTGRPVNVKKGQWLAPQDMVGAVEKIRAAGGREIAVTERGTAFGYGRWVVDMRSFKMMSEATNCVTVFDASHSVQLAGAGRSVSGGEPEFIESLSLAAVGAGANGLFVEVHPDPSQAASDGSNVLPLDRVEGLVQRCSRVQEVVVRE